MFLQLIAIFLNVTLGSESAAARGRVVAMRDSALLTGVSEHVPDAITPSKTNETKHFRSRL